MGATALISSLKPHPDNSYYFDDMVGEDWERLLRSVKTSGVMEPIIVTEDDVIVSGYQRVRASIANNIGRIKIDRQYFENEDAVLKCLIESNICRRGGARSNSPHKTGRCIKKMEEFYDIREGSANEKGTIVGETVGHREGNNCPHEGDPKTEEELAKKLNISLTTLKNYKRLADLSPEIIDFIETGSISSTAALSIAKSLSKEDQEVLASHLDSETKYTAKKLQSYIDQIEYLKSHPTLPDDYEDMKAELKSKEAELEDALAMAADYNNRASESEANAKTIEQLKAELAARDEELQNKDEEIRKLQSDTVTYHNAAFLERNNTDVYRMLDGGQDIYELGVKIQKMLEEDLAPLKFKRCIEAAKVTDTARNNLQKMLDDIQDWCKEIEEVIGNSGRSSKIIDM